MLYHKTVKLSEIVPVDVPCKAYTLERNGPRLYLRIFRINTVSTATSVFMPQVLVVHLCSGSWISGFH